MCDPSDMKESSRAVLFCGTGYFAVQGGYNFQSYKRINGLDEILHSTICFLAIYKIKFLFWQLSELNKERIFSMDVRKDFVALKIPNKLN